MPSPTPAQDHDRGATSRSFECSWWPAALVGALFLGSHLLFLARSPHDLDGVNFALGVRDFDITRHQPHPPGYPLFILLGRLAVWALGPFVSVLGTRPAGLEVETLALSAWSAIAGGIAALVLFDLFCSLGIGRRTALAGTALTVSCPAYFFMGVRPMSDLPGLAVSFAAAALAVRAATRATAGDERGSQACLIASVARWRDLHGRRHRPARPGALRRPPAASLQPVLRAGRTRRECRRPAAESPFSGRQSRPARHSGASQVSGPTTPRRGRPCRPTGSTCSAPRARRP